MRRLIAAFLNDIAHNKKRGRMTMKVMPTSKSITPNRTYTFEEVYEKLKAEANLPAEPYIHKVLGMKGVYIP